MKIRRLRPTDASIYRELRLRGLFQSPSAFGCSNEEESKRPLVVTTARLAPHPDSWTFGRFVADKLVGTISVVRFKNLKERHKAGVYGMYVAPEYRRLDIGRLLLEHTIARARRMPDVLQLQLAVNESNLVARKLYEKFGFEIYGREANALRVGSEFHHELLMVLAL